MQLEEEREERGEREKERDRESEGLIDHVAYRNLQELSNIAA